MAVALRKGVCPLCGVDYPHDVVARGPDFEYRTTGPQEFQLVRCRQCAMVLLDPRPDDDAIPTLYPATYEPYRFEQLHPLVKAGRDFVQRRKTRWIAAHAPAGGTIVDVGCGNGSLLRLLRADHGPRFRLIGWDYAGPHLDELASHGIEVIAAPIDPAHVPGGVDLFVLNQVIEHVPHPDRLLNMLAGALKPGGLVLIETPDTSGVDARMFARRYWGGYHLPRHMVLFNRQNLATLVTRCGLEPVESSHLASPAFWIQSLHHAASESPLPSLASLFTLRNVPLVALVSAR